MRMTLPDLLQPRALSPMVPRVIAIIGVLVSCTGAVRVWQAEHRLAQATAEHEAARLLAVDRPARTPPAPVAAARGSASRGAQGTGARATIPGSDTADAERVALARFLEVDWNHRLLLVEQSGAGIVSLTGFKLDANRGTLELRGETTSLERFEVLRRRLLEGGVGTVLLSRHEFVQRPGGSRLAFVASAEWPR